ncbi:MAG TPA: class I SAM-dependent methyltransferase [Xanthobacteraceae bacterium]|nr:class I SAM-dependent methyltransferase [Xanthobacteraceae bacterium]
MRSPPNRLSSPLLRYVNGELPANVALAQLLMTSETAALRAELARSIRQFRREQREVELRRVLRLRTVWKESPEAARIVRMASRAISHDCASPDDWNRAFSELARAAPDAGVALYSLGRRELLDAATEEIAGFLHRQQLITPGTTLIDIGCGSGRVLRRLAPEIRFGIGIDVSGGMLSAARTVAAEHDNIALLRTSGRDLACLRSQTFDLACAVDSFPYLLLSGVAHDGLRETARVLKPGGSLLVLNYSYRGDDEADRADIRNFAQEFGFTIRRNGTREFSLWDAAAFLLRKEAEHGTSAER